MADIRLVTSLEEAEKLWRRLSPQRTIFDDWDFRACFYKYNPHPLRFYVAQEKMASGDFEAVGLLPLMLHPEHGLEFFAEDPCEENRVFTRAGYERVIPDLYGQIQEKAQFLDISGEDDFTRQLELEDYKYLLPLDGLKSFDDFLDKRLSAKRRRGLRSELARLAVEKVETYLFNVNGRDDLDQLFAFNLKTFGLESYLIKEEQPAWRDIWQKFPGARLSVLTIGGESQAVSLSIIYNNHWHYLITGVNFQDWPGLGKYLVKANIEEAIVAGCTMFDAGLGDCGWKDIWHLDRLPQYQFAKFVD